MQVNLIQNACDGQSIQVMARSKYIYHIREPKQGLLIASFTVKYEAHQWMVRSGFSFSDYNLFRVRDGILDIGQKKEVKVDWDE